MNFLNSNRYNRLITSSKLLGQIYSHPDIAYVTYVTQEFCCYRLLWAKSCFTG